MAGNEYQVTHVTIDEKQVHVRFESGAEWHLMRAEGFELKHTVYQDTQKDGWLFNVLLPSKSREHAIKIATEKLAQWRAKKDG